MQMVPADILVLETSAANNECFVQTATLDGERTLKSKTGIETISNQLTSLNDYKKLEG